MALPIMNQFTIINDDKCLRILQKIQSGKKKPFSGKMSKFHLWFCSQWRCFFFFYGFKTDNCLLASDTWASAQWPCQAHKQAPATKRHTTAIFTPLHPSNLHHHQTDSHTLSQSSHSSWQTACGGCCRWGRLFAASWQWSIRVQGDGELRGGGLEKKEGQTNMRSNSKALMLGQFRDHITCKHSRFDWWASPTAAQWTDVLVVSRKNWPSSRVTGSRESVR